MDVLKYNRVQGKLVDVLKADKISAITVGENALVIGTFEGLIHVTSFTGQTIKTYKVHNKRINDLSLDNFGIILLSCSDNGTVVIQSLDPSDEKETVIHFNEPLISIAIEDDITVKRERSFVVGGVSGQLVYHRQVWFSQKNVVLFGGNESPVQKIVWRGNFIAWADSSQVRLMDISTQSAICYINCPLGVGPQNPYPCSLWWDSDTDLLIGWADSFRHLRLVSTPLGGNNVDVTSTLPSIETSATTVAEWQSDSIICGLASMDVDHILILGYVPAAITPQSPENTPDSGQSVADYPELLVVTKATGMLISADTLPLRGSPGDFPAGAPGAGPWGCKLRSDHLSIARRDNHSKWSLKQTSQHLIRGGMRGLSPTVFISSVSDIVVTRVRDSDDRVSMAIEQGDLKIAVDLALADPLSLRQHSHREVISLYLQSLLDADKAEEAAKECPKLLKQDAAQWEKFVYAFSLKRRLSCLAPLIPTNDPRLPSELYEMVLDHFLTSNSKSFLELVQSWGRVKPSVFDIAAMISRLETRRRLLTNPNLGPGTRLGASTNNSFRPAAATSPTAQQPLDPFCLEAQAQLYVYSQQYDKALTCYLDIQGLQASSQDTQLGYDLAADSQTSSGAVGGAVSERKGSQHVFELIEKEELYSVVKGQILNLVRLSRSQAGPLLVRHLNYFPVAAVASQLAGDRCLLLWYLHLLFREVPDKYNVSEYAEFHVLQVSLYVEFSPRKIMSPPVAVSVVPGDRLDEAAEAVGPNEAKDMRPQLLRPRTPSASETDLLKFLKASSFVPLEHAYRECMKARPPLYAELVFVLTRMGNIKEALNVLLRDICDVQQCIGYVQDHDVSLWEEVVNYCDENHTFLVELLDHIGWSGLDASAVISKIPARGVVPGIHYKLLRILKGSEFQAFLSKRCKAVVSLDAIGLLRALSHNQRKAIKVDPTTSRCGLCGRPLHVSPGSPSVPLTSKPLDMISESSQSNTLSIGLLGGTVATNPPEIWGTGRRVSASHRSTMHPSAFGKDEVPAVVFSNRHVFHQLCFETLQDSLSKSGTATATVSSAQAPSSSSSTFDSYTG